jgi:proline iminopeptidase
LPHGVNETGVTADATRAQGPPSPAKPAFSDIPNFVKVRERPLKTHVVGRGATVFVCPVGWGVPGEMSLHALGPFMDMARWFSFDPSGTGESTPLRAKEDLGARGVANDSSGMLLRLKLRPAALFGHSHGGGAALRVAINHPELVRRLIVVATTPGGTEDPWNWRRVLGDGIAPQALQTREEFLRVLRKLTTGSLADPSRAGEIFGGIEEKKWAVSVERFNAMPREWRLYDLRNKMQHVAAPTLIVAGRKDPLVDMAAAEAIRAEIPKSELVVFESSGHFPMLEEPQKFRTVLKEFLERD